MPNGSRVLVLNTQAMNADNFYLGGFKDDPADHLAWIEAQLAQIEAEGGIAYMIGHI